MEAAVLPTEPPSLRRTDKYLCNFKALDVKSNSLDTLCDVLHGVAVFASKLLQKTKSAQPVTPLDAKTIKSWQEMFEVVEKIRSADTKRKEDIVFQLLFIHVGFQVRRLSTYTRFFVSSLVEGNEPLAQ